MSSLTYGQEYYRRNKDKWKTYNGDTQAMNAKKVKWRIEHPEKALLAGIKSRCKQKSIPFDLDISDIVVPEYCPYLGLKLECSTGEGKKDSSTSVDRIIPSLGYVKGNIEIMSELANRMKNSATKEQLVSFAKAVLWKYD